MTDTDDHELLRRASIELEAAVAAAVEARAAHRHVEDVLAALLATTSEGVVVIDAAGVVVLCSAAAEAAWGARVGVPAADLPLPSGARAVPLGAGAKDAGMRLVVSGV